MYLPITGSLKCLQTKVSVYYHGLPWSTDTPIRSLAITPSTLTGFLACANARPTSSTKICDGLVTEVRRFCRSASLVRCHWRFQIAPHSLSILFSILMDYYDYDTFCRPRRGLKHSPSVDWPQHSFYQHNSLLSPNHSTPQEELSGFMSYPHHQQPRSNDSLNLPQQQPLLSYFAVSLAQLSPLPWSRYSEDQARGIRQLHELSSPPTKDVWLP